VLGRIFDQRSDHNLDCLMATATKRVAHFSREALAARKRAVGLSADEADRFVRHAFEPSVDDFFLDALDKALWHLLHNGRKPTLEIRPFALPPAKTTARAQLRPGEKIYQEVNAVLQQIAWGRTSMSGKG
jgi:hypothetical protein